MDNKSKHIIYYVLSLALVFTAPFLILSYIVSSKDEVFYERIQKDNETCRRRAAQDLADARWCDEIKDAATRAYNESIRESKSPLTLLFFIAPFLVLAIRVGYLSNQVKKLREKIDV